MQEKQEKGSKERPGGGCPWEEGEIQGRSREDPGMIHRSKEFGVQGCRRKYEKGTRREGIGEEGKDKDDRVWRSPWESSEEQRGEV